MLLISRTPSSVVSAEWPTPLRTGFATAVEGLFSLGPARSAAQSAPNTQSSAVHAVESSPLSIWTNLNSHLARKPPFTDLICTDQEHQAFRRTCGT